jgi:hypothetical protein
MTRQRRIGLWMAGAGVPIGAVVGYAMGGAGVAVLEALLLGGVGLGAAFLGPQILRQSRPCRSRRSRRRPTSRGLRVRVRSHRARRAADRPHSDAEELVDPKVEAAKGRRLLRWFLILLSAQAVVGVLFGLGLLLSALL